MPTTWQQRMAHYVLSLPERVVRSASGLAAGLLHEIGEAALPAAVRRTRLYRSMVEATLRFLIEQVGEVEGIFPTEGRLAEDFLVRRAAGNGIEVLGLLTFRASPVWVLAALADLSGGGRHLISEISASLRREGVLAPDAHPESVDQLLDALEQVAGRAAEAINTPPLDVAGLRKEWSDIRRGFATLPRPDIGMLERLWRDLTTTAEGEGRGIFEFSAAMALGAVVALRTTGTVLSESLLDHYAKTLAEIRRQGFLQWWTREFRPYLRAAAAQFSPAKQTRTQRFISR
jgi:hypothetical protein